MLEHQYYAFGACLVLFALALVYSARGARAYHLWYKKQKDQARARDMLKKMQDAGEAPSSSSDRYVSEEQAVARKACPFAKWAQESASCPVSGASKASLLSDNNETKKKRMTKDREDKGDTQDAVAPGRPSVPKHPREKYEGWYQTNKMTGKKLRERKIVPPADS